MPFYRYVSELSGATPAIPQPFINLFSGGAHAGGQVGIQDVQIIVRARRPLSNSLETATAVYRAAAQLSLERFGMRLLRADEGGLAPPFPDSRSMLAAAVDAIEFAGRRPIEDVALAVDVAASQLWAAGGYTLDGAQVDLVEASCTWLREFPVVSLEDPLAEEDWAGWTKLSREVGNVLLVGDDLVCTQVDRIQHAQELGCANALLLKPNQVGTLTESLAALETARARDWTVVVSARSGGD